jgi:thiol-disulfide isomerase/thioredoxin
MLIRARTALVFFHFFLFLLAAAPVAAGSGAPFWKALDRADRRAREGRLEEAHSAALEAVAMAPESPFALMEAAEGAARLGRTEEAFDFIERAVAGGYRFSDQAREIPAFSSLLQDARFEALLAAMKTEAERWEAETRSARPELPIERALPFRSHRKLAAAFDARERRESRSSWRLSWNASAAASRGRLDERLAALRRYLAEHPDAADREAAAWDAVETLIEHRYPYGLPDRWGDHGRQTLAEIDRFLEQYPASPHRGEARILRAFSAFGIRPEGGTPEAPWRDEDVAKLDAALAAVAEEHARTTAGGLATARRLIVADKIATGEVTPQLRELRAVLAELYETDAAVAEVLRLEGRAAVIRVDGLGGFEGTDLDGRTWSNESFLGKVTLVDFWATWCGPCVAELPTLKRAWADYRERGFQLVGVSLDSDDRESFERWCRENGVGWPQILDGEVWDGALVKRLRVQGVPFGVLVDRDGRVAAADLRGRVLLERIERLLGSPETAPR